MKKKFSGTEIVSKLRQADVRKILDTTNLREKGKGVMAQHRRFGNAP